MPVFLWAASILLVLAGIAGTLVPALPGTPLVFVGLLLAAWIDGFQRVGAATLVVLALLTAAALAVDLVSASLGARRSGASREAVVGAFMGTVAGLFFGLPGLILGPFIGAVIGEFLARRDLRRAGGVAVGTWLGFVCGVLVKLALAFAMVGIFVISYVL
jgi:uncharacterized protein YqgC (DUF456 family)